MTKTKKSDVYFIALDQYEKTLACFDKLGVPDLIKKNAYVAIKTHFGEKGNKGFVKPEKIKPIATYIKKLGANPFVTDANTIYRGQRTDAINHLTTASGHGFRLETCGAPIIIADGLRGNNYVSVEIGQKHFKSVKVAKDIYESDFIVFISHFKGHMLTGFGGAIKNIGMGCGSRAGKYEMHAEMVPEVNTGKCTGCGACIPHCAGYSLTLSKKKIVLDKKKCVGCGECILACPERVFNMSWDRTGDLVQENLVEYALGVMKDKHGVYINFVNYITPHCDCLPSHDEPLIDDIGITISLDPVAIDQASLDLVNKKAGKELFRTVHPNANYDAQLSYAEELGLGNRAYNLINL